MKMKQQVCNLASIGLPMFVEDKDCTFIESVRVYGRSNCIYCDISKKHLKIEELHMNILMWMMMRRETTL